MWCAELLVFLRRIGVAVVAQPPPTECSLNMTEVLAKFDAWFFASWSNLPKNPRNAPSEKVMCCTYDQWFAKSAAAKVSPGWPVRRLPLKVKVA